MYFFFPLDLYDCVKSQFEVNIFPVIRNRCLVLYWDLVFGSYSKNIIEERDV